MPNPCKPRCTLGKWRGCEVAVKILRGGVSPETAADFRSEVDMLASLRHPNILLFLGAALDSLPVCLGYRVQCSCYQWNVRFLLCCMSPQSALACGALLVSVLLQQPACIA